MSWCPKCHYEYQSGFTNCSDCGSELVEFDPISFFGIPRTWLILIELSATFALSFWLCYVFRFVPVSADMSRLLLLIVVIWGGSFLYGLIRHIRISTRLWLLALLIGSLAQVAVEVTVVTFGASEVWKLMFIVPVGLIFSTISLTLVAAGSLVRHKRASVRVTIDN